jgi:hypothetical protein
MMMSPKKKIKRGEMKKKRGTNKIKKKRVILRWALGS